MPISVPNHISNGKIKTFHSENSNRLMSFDHRKHFQYQLEFQGNDSNKEKYKTEIIYQVS